MAIITTTLVTGGTAAVNVSQNSPAVVYAVRNGGSANTVGTITIADGSNTKEVLQAATTPGTGREYYGSLFPSGIRITNSNAGDTAVVIWAPA